MTTLVLILFFFVILSIVYFKSLPTGEKAIAKMTPEERKYLEEKLQKITIGTPYQEVKNILGPPNRGIKTQRPTWKFPNSKGRSQIAIYLTDENTVRKIRWMKIGKFVWEKE